MGKVVYLKNYIKQKDGPLTDKIVVGSDIRPSQAVNLVLMNSPLQVVTNGFDENKVVNLKSNLKEFSKDPCTFLFDSKDEGSSFQQKFFKNSKKDDFLLQIENFLKTGQYRKVREDVYLMADELFTNFAKSASEDNKSMQFSVDCCEDNVVISCKDSFGTLNPKVMLENISRCYQNGVKQSIRLADNTGAGIGSYLMYSLSAGMIIAVRPGQESIVVVWMPKSVYHEDRIDMNKCLIVINEES